VYAALAKDLGAHVVATEANRSTGVIGTAVELGMEARPGRVVGMFDDLHQRRLGGDADHVGVEQQDLGEGRQELVDLGDVTQQAGERVMTSLESFLSKRLCLLINREKSAVVGA
jgi:hypothetical protein